MEYTLNSNERIDHVNENITLIQRTDGLTFGTDALLLSAYINSKSKKCAEFGSGTGIISLLLLHRKKASVVYAYEVQEAFASLTQRNAHNNGFDCELKVICSDIRNASSLQTDGECDIVFSNPPYMRNGAGLSSATDEKNIARREIFGGIGDFCLSAKKLLKYGGRFYCVYRPDRLSELLFSMKSADIEPKRLTLVYPDHDSPPSLVLVEGRYGGGEELHVTRPLFIYRGKDHSEYTDDLKYIYENGNFPEKRYI